MTFPHLGADERAESGAGQLRLDLSQRRHQRPLVVFEHPGLHRSTMRGPGLQAVPKTKQIGYYSDVQAGIRPAEVQHVSPASWQAFWPTISCGRDSPAETQALELARLLLRDNAKRIFNV